MEKQVDPADPRLDERSNVFLAATIQSASRSYPVRIRNISAMGALIEGQSLPGERQKASLRRGNLTADGEVAWQNGALRGIRFDAPVDVDAWVQRAGGKARRSVRRQPSNPKPVVDLAQSGTANSLADELLEISERLALLPNLGSATHGDLRRIRSIAQSLKEAIGKA